MLRKKEINEETTQLEVLGTITNVYGQVASFWMKNAGDSIIKSRGFLDEMHEVFNTVFASYSQQVKALARRKKANKNGHITFLAHNGKNVGVFLSAGTGFYGEIVKKTFELFIKEVREKDLEVTIVGRQGLFFFLNEEPKRPYTFFDFPDEKVDQAQLTELVKHLVPYEEIRIYHGKFNNFLSQEPVVLRISADPYSELQEEQKKPKYYLFEPDIEKILVYFEKEIFTSLFEQSIRESQMAKFGSRLMVMDQAGENIKEELKKMEQERRKLTHRINNGKQINQFASMSLWNRNVG